MMMMSRRSSSVNWVKPLASVLVMLVKDNVPDLLSRYFCVPREA